ncbi:MAG: bifunctional (p)ppGpp synthetase/guanosine-3',5'-bis(diphosphate) 3'-pyrophosphohydrolase [Candidatus Woesearchaeota archaeon]|nr:bifunctional (p)ppGpp synthetase/guanosine-3',5'-bis(diphosphate) 3'-pyrophosphohydrolase [Candidatus Woesearchaeota archaeon]
MVMGFNEFIAEVLEFNPKADKELIKKAFEFSESAHKEHKRESGDPYFIHPLETARILIKLSADSATICAALLHDCIEEGCSTVEEIKKIFGAEIASIVEGLTKIQGIQFESKEDYKAENLRKMLLATTKDIRVMLIKLADRLHNMRTLKYFREDKQKRIAKETLEIFAPIAHKLGMNAMKGELEDLSLKYLEPEAYSMLRKRIASNRREREERTKAFIKHIKDGLNERGIEAVVEGRAKYFYSIYQKMKKEGKDFNEIYDLIAIRIITKTVPECYAAIGIVHDLFKPIPGRFKDYISVPKTNGYQSLHTSVLGEHGRIIEIQIRTQEMHHIAEEGVAAHWRYKGTEKDKKFDRRIRWIKQLLDWKMDSKTTKDFIEDLKIDLFENEIIVFTPKGDPISLPEGSTPVDFAYEVHTNIGLHCSKAEVNGVIVPLDYKLRNGDIVYIVTRDNAKPSRNWLSFVKTPKAKSKIRSELGISPDMRVEESAGEKKDAAAGSIEILSKKAPLKFSKCCSPKHGDPVIAFYTKDGKITVHNKDCKSLHDLAGNKTADVRWKEKERESKRLRIVVRDSVGVLAGILDIIAKAGISIHSIYTRAKKDKVVVTINMATMDDDAVKSVIKAIRSIKDVLDIRETSGMPDSER